MPPRPRPSDLVVFLGPSLPGAEAKRLASCHVLPPARQGDVFRALAARPRAIALIDGVFEAQPSVWHHEILEALSSGVAVFGGASMGALRAAELHRHGMVGVGRVFEWYRDGQIVDDAEVALLHASSEHGFRAATVPLVNVRHAAQVALEKKVLTKRDATSLVEAAARVFYQDRTWPRVLEGAALSSASRERWAAFAKAGLPDLKADDARACISAAAAFVQSGGALPVVRHARTPSSFVRRRALLDGASGEVASRAVVEALQTEQPELADDGLRRALLVRFGKTLGLSVSDDEIASMEKDFLAAHGVRPAGRDRFLSELGLDEVSARRFFEELALDALMLESAERLFTDGPSPLEALASQARVTGAWLDTARTLAKRKR